MSIIKVREEEEGAREKEKLGKILSKLRVKN